MHLQRLLREPPAALVSGIIDTDLPSLSPEDSLAAVTRYFAAYNLVCGPVVDEENHLLGAVSVDDVLDHLLPDDWRERERSELSGAVLMSPAERLRRGDMSDLSARQRLDTPRTSRRRFAFNLDPEAVGQFSESIARFLGTGRYLAWQTILVIVWIAAEPVRRHTALGPLPVHPAQPGVLHAGGVRRAA